MRERGPHTHTTKCVGEQCLKPKSMLNSQHSVRLHMQGSWFVPAMFHLVLHALRRRKCSLLCHLQEEVAITTILKICN